MQRLNQDHIADDNPRVHQKTMGKTSFAARRSSSLRPSASGFSSLRLFSRTIAMAATMMAAAPIGNVPGELIDEKPDIRHA